MESKKKYRRRGVDVEKKKLWKLTTLCQDCQGDETHAQHRETGTVLRLCLDQATLLKGRGMPEWNHFKTAMTSWVCAARNSPPQDRPWWVFYIHVKDAQDKYRYAQTLSHRLDASFNRLLPSGVFFSDAFRKTQVREGSLTFIVMHVLSSSTFLATVDFKSWQSTDSGLERSQYTRHDAICRVLYSRVTPQPAALRAEEEMEGTRLCAAEKAVDEAKRSLREGRLKNNDELALDESSSLQLRRLAEPKGSWRSTVWTPKSIVDSVWKDSTHNLPAYVTAFAKNQDGGIVWFGVSTERVHSGKEQLEKEGDREGGSGKEHLEKEGDREGASGKEQLEKEGDRGGGSGKKQLEKEGEREGGSGKEQLEKEGDREGGSRKKQLEKEGDRGGSSRKKQLEKEGDRGGSSGKKHLEKEGDREGASGKEHLEKEGEREGSSRKKHLEKEGDREGGSGKKHFEKEGERGGGSRKNQFKKEGDRGGRSGKEHLEKEGEREGGSGKKQVEKEGDRGQGSGKKKPDKESDILPLTCYRIKAFRCEGYHSTSELNEAMKKDLQSRIKTKMLWLKRDRNDENGYADCSEEEIERQFRVTFIPVYNEHGKEEGFILEVAVAPFQGLVFHDPHGPHAYSMAHSKDFPTNPFHFRRMAKQEWFSRLRQSGWCSRQGCCTEGEV